MSAEVRNFVLTELPLIIPSTGIGRENVIDRVDKVVEKVCGGDGLRLITPSAEQEEEGVHCWVVKGCLLVSKITETDHTLASLLAAAPIGSSYFYDKVRMHLMPAVGKELQKIYARDRFIYGISFRELRDRLPEYVLRDLKKQWNLSEQAVS